MSRTTLTAQELDFVQAQRVARLATSDASGAPYAVPVCYACDGDRFYTPIDDKPKRVPASALRRVRNIEARSDAVLLIDRYDDDWSRLGYVQIRGRAVLLSANDAEHSVALRLLRERYLQYRVMDLEQQPVIAVTPTHITSWGPAISSLPVQSPWLEPGRGGDVLPLMRGRQSVRTYLERPVPREALETMLEAARWAPSPHGSQPWRFAVLTRAEPKQQLADAMGSDWQRTLEMDGESPAVVATRLARSRERILRAPALILVCLYTEDLDHYPDSGRQGAEGVMAIQSLGATVQNMLLAAYSLGLDTGWMCAPLFTPDSVRSALALDHALTPHALLTVGYKAQEPRRRPHRPADDLVVRFD
jgi:PPOX class probable F420-dependent enzyme